MEVQHAGYGKVTASLPARAILEQFLADVLLIYIFLMGIPRFPHGIVQGFGVTSPPHHA